MDDNNNKNNNKKDVPYIVHESALARMERIVKRFFILLIIAVLVIFASNAFWLWAWMQYDYTGEETVYTYQQDGEGVNIVGDNNTGGIYGAESNDP